MIELGECESNNWEKMHLKNVFFNRLRVIAWLDSIERIIKLIRRSERPFLPMLAVFLLLLSSVSHADERAKKLDGELTPLGAERAANKSGSIPAWVGDSKRSEALSKELLDESPLFVIKASNMETYSDFLTEGQKLLFSAYAETFEMPIYKSHRLHLAPPYLYEATKKNLVDAQLTDDGNGLSQAWPGVPFPIPQSGLELLWNHLTAWRGIHFKSGLQEVVVFDDGATSVTESQLEFASPFHAPDRSQDIGKGLLFYYLSRTLAPASLAGGATLVHESVIPVQQPRKTWIYVSGEGRIRRLPSLTHDGPSMNSGNIRVVDEVNLFNGAPDRYDWELLGKKEIYIPYNNEKLNEALGNIEALLDKHHLKPQSTRYELHRVWVLEGRLKPGERHIYPRRRLYIDEDNWMAVLSEQFNFKDELWRVSTSYTKYYPQMPGNFVLADVFHDVLKKQYFLQAAGHGEHRGIKYFDQLPDARMFNPAALKRISH